MKIVPDISFYQDKPDTPRKVDFTVMRQRTDTVIIRAGQYQWKDKQFDYHWEASKEAGLKRGSYWYYDNRGDPKRQAELYSTILGNDIGEFYCWLDLEDRASGPYRGWKHWYDFIERFKALQSTAKVGIYTGYYYFNEFAYGQTYFAQYPLWIAAYSPKPVIPHIWDDWLLWQYTSNGVGAEYGVESNDIDLNWCKEDFTAPEETIIASFANQKVEYRKK